MSGKSLVPIQLPRLDSIPATNPAEGFYKLYLRDNKLRILDSAGNENIVGLGDITISQINNWNEAYSWGDHADAGYVTLNTAQVITAAKIFDSSVQAATFVKTGGSSLQFLKADGSVDNSTYLTTGDAASTYVSLAGNYNNPTWIASLDWSKLTGIPAITLNAVTTAGNTTTNPIIVGGVTVATNLIHTDVGSGRVGIGTLTPAYKLDVAGQAYFASGIVTNIGVPIKLIVNNGTLNDASEFRTGFGELKIYSGRYNNVHQSFVFATGDNYVSGSTRMVIFGPTGNVAINTATDSGYRLDVNGSVRGSMFVVTGGTSSQFLKADGTLDSNTYLTTVGASEAYVSLNGSYANPSWITALAWTKITGAPAFLTAEVDTLSSVTGRGATTATTLVYTGTGDAIRPNTDSIGVLGASNFRWATVYSRGLSAGANTLDIAGPAINLNDASGNIKVKLFGSTGNVTIQNGGTHVDAGYRLDVIGTTRIQGDITLNVISALLKTSAAGLVSAAVAGTDYVVPGTLSSYVPNTRTLTINGTTFDLSANRSWTIATSTLDAVTAAGNTTTNAITVGGVKSTADYELRVDSGAANTRLGRFKFIRSTYDPTGVAASIDFWRGAAGNEGILAFSTNPGTAGDNAAERMRITTGGNILIGTTTDSGYKLDVNGTIKTNAFWTTGSGIVQWGPFPSAYGTLTWDTGYARIHATSGNRLDLGASGGLHMTISTAGRVGIGTTAPSDLLDVQGVIRFSSAANQSVNGYARIYTSYNYAKGEVYIEPEGSTNPTRFFPNGGVVIGTANQNPPTNGLIVSGNVGIGTTSPGEKLQVAGNVHISGVGSALYFDTDAAPKSIVQYVNNLYEFHIYNGRGITSRIIGANSFVSLGSGTTQMLYLNTGSGNVLIGTTTDGGYKLDVNGTIRSVNGAYFATSSGNVGIGTTTPSEKLTVVGNGFFTSTTGASISIGTGYQPGSNATPLYTNLNFRGYADIIKAQIKSYDISSNASTGVMIFSVAATGDVLTEYMRISSLGNVGIGTTTPDYKLHIVNSEAAHVGLFVSNSRAYGVGQGAWGSALHLGKEEGGTNQTMGLIIGAPLNETSSADGYLSFGTRTGGVINTRMYIANTGNVGVGTTSPTIRLTVIDPSNTVAAFIGGGAASPGGLGIGTVNSGVRPFIQSYTAGAAATTDLSINPSGGNVGIGTTSPGVKLDVVGSAMRVQSSLTDASSKEFAFIQGHYTNAQASLNVISTVSNATQNIIWIGGGNASYNTATDIRFFTAATNTTLTGTERMRIASDGSVGIGTTSPTSRLHVAGGRIEIDNGFNLESRTTSGNALTNLIGMSTNAINVGVWEGNFMGDLFLKGGNGSVFADFSQGNSKFFAVRGGVASATPTEYMRVNHLGNVLIGTTTDAGYRLNVNGTARVTSNLLVDGSIGIGIATPSARYHQYQTQGIMARYDISSPNANQNRGVWDFYTNAATAADFFGRFGFKFEGGVSDSFKQFQLHIADSVTPKFVVDGAGRVGIGTIVPGAKLHVFGTDELLKFGDGTSGNNAFMSFNDRGYVGFNGSAGLNFIANSTRPIVFGTGSTFATYTEWARFATGTGNLLINTNTDAGYKLDVNGTARVQSQLQVDGNVTVTNVVQAFAVTADVVTADSIAKSGGTDSQFLKADGSVDETSYATSDLSIAYAIALG